MVVVGGRGACVCGLGGGLRTVHCQQRPTVFCSIVAASPRAKMVPLLPLTRRCSSVTAERKWFCSAVHGAGVRPSLAGARPGLASLRP